MIILTGGLGFIGSNILQGLNEIGYDNIIICDWHKKIGGKNVANQKFIKIINPDSLFNFLKSNKNIEYIIHMGAISSTTENNFKLIYNNNTVFSRNIWNWCTLNNVKLIYASSAATYGDGSNGFNDLATKAYKPLNYYGWSKYFFDKYATKQSQNKKNPPQWVGLKFFNVYGPNEYHKGKMQSVVKHSVDQIKEHGYVNLFKSYNSKYKNGGQIRDFIYVNDCISVIQWFIKNPQISGIFNCGTGEGRTFEDLVKAVFQTIKKSPKINYIEMPDNIKNQYQYYTKAENIKLKNIGYKKEFTSLEDGISDYLKNYLLKNNIYR